MSEIPGFIRFELDLIRAVIDQLVFEIDSIDGASLIVDNISRLPNAQGVYQLIHGSTVKYVGKTDAQAGLRTRIEQHFRKLQQRHNIIPEDVTFRAVALPGLTAIDIETELIKRYGTKDYWNGSSFGSHDPGRERETTNKSPQGFDAQFPISIDLPGSFIQSGDYSVAELLRHLKEALPYTFRYETVGRGSQAYKISPHPDYETARVTVPVGSHTVRELIRLVLEALPEGWQATEFVSHVILYKESRTYVHGQVI